ncbi:MAG TPA: EAL domain-containing protein, partial [Terracidiphilus sp.]|nr:EAL domain-containing protein [Terracidiphilus sp.]
MRATVQRVLVICLAALLGIAGGGFAGYKLARSFILGHSVRRIAESASRATAEMSLAVDEARRVLAAINTSAVQSCSDAEIAQLRGRMFESHYLKEAGRISDGRIACSTSLGKVTTGAALPLPDFRQGDGTELYRNLAPFRIDGAATVTIRRGDAFVVYNPFGNGELSALTMKYSITAKDAVRNATGVMAGEAAPLDQADVMNAAAGIKNGQVFATRCAAVGSGCVTIYTPVAEIVDNSQNVIVMLVVMGALAGGLFGIVCAQLYARTRGLPAQLLQAIRDDMLTVVYQPIVDLETGCIVEAEALARWTDEQGNLVSPDVFISIAEERGFVGEITRLVVHRALLELGPTLRGRSDFRVSVNVAAQDLADSAFLPMLQGALEQTGVSAESLGIEITESFTARQQVAKESIRRLRERGHCVAIDDFGTGYSSLAYLHDLSVDAIKIDKAF